MPHDLYRHWDKDDRLLYVGTSINALYRAGMHRTQKCWWDDVVTITVEHFPDKVAALRAEKRAVRTESPLYNDSTCTRSGDTCTTHGRTMAPRDKPLDPAAFFAEHGDTR